MELKGKINKFKTDLIKSNEVYLRIKVRPNSAKTEIKDVMIDETIKIDIAAAPERGKANAVLTKFLAGEFSVSKNGVKIISGAGERIKLVKIKM